MQLLPAAVDVARQPRWRDVVAAERGASPRDEPAVKPLVDRFWKVLPRRRAQRGVLTGHVPPIPHEAIASRAARLGEPRIERAAERTRLGRELIDDDDVAHVRKCKRRHGQAAAASAEPAYAYLVAGAVDGAD